MHRDKVVNVIRLDSNVGTSSSYGLHSWELPEQVEVRPGALATAMDKSKVILTLWNSIMRTRRDQTTTVPC